MCSDVPARRNVVELAIDSALIRHISVLFDKFASDLEIELGANPEEVRGSATPGAIARMDKKFTIAMMAHAEMLEMMKRKQS